MKARHAALLPLHVLMATFLLVAVGASSPSEAQTTRQQQQRRGVLGISGTRGISDTYAVNGRSVSVNGRGHRIVLRGRCPSLRVAGTNNHVYVDAVRSVSLSGSNNRVYWRSRYNGRNPRVTRTGTGNYVTRRTNRNR